jgi:hypothetical protein
MNSNVSDTGRLDEVFDHTGKARKAPYKKDGRDRLLWG